MTFARTLGHRLALVSLLLLAPAVASAAIVVERQPGPSDNWAIMARLGYVTNNGVFNLLTKEGSPAGTKIGLRSAATGALLAQTALPYTVNQLWFQDLDGDDIPELLVFDGLTGKCTCLN